MLEVITTWTGLGKNPKQTVMYFAGTGSAEALIAVNRTRALWEFLKGGIANTMTAQVSGEVRNLDPVTGELLAVLGVAAPAPSVGTISASQAADATQYLVQWNTGVVADGRVVKGRTFVPGVPVSSITGGNVTPSILASFRTDVATWVTASPTFVIWHRPKYLPAEGGTVLVRDGQQMAVLSGTVWNEFGVQRRRRG